MLPEIAFGLGIADLIIDGMEVAEIGVEVGEGIGIGAGEAMVGGGLEGEGIIEGGEGIGQGLGGEGEGLGGEGEG